MFVFENLIDIDERGIQTLLREIASDQLLLALRGADDGLTDQVMQVLIEVRQQLRKKKDFETAARFREEELTLVGKLSSWVVIVVLVVIAISTEKTLVRLLELKFEVLIQVVPCFFLGLYWKRLGSTTRASRSAAPGAERIRLSNAFSS